MEKKAIGESRNIHEKKGFYEKIVKRAIDFSCSLAALVCLSPLLLVVAILVRMKLGTPVIFKQPRPGRNEQIFNLYKFRTMTDARDEQGDLLPDSRRMTPFGHKLRALSLDELPELINILKGDMAIVGPRPLLTRYLPFYTEEERLRHSVRPGLTGLAQIHGRNSVEEWEKRFSYDVQYVRKITFLGDLKILFGTVGSVFKADGVVDPGYFDDFDVYRKKQWEAGVEDENGGKEKK